MVYRHRSSVKSFFFFVRCKGMQSEDIPLPKPAKRFWSSPLSASMSKLWMGMVFLNCQQLESRLPTFFLCVCSTPTAKWGWNKGQWQSDHTRHIFEGSPTLAKPHRKPTNTARAKVLFTYSSYALLVDSSFSSKSPQQDENKSNFQTASYL